MVDIVEQLDQQEPEQQDPPSKRRLLYDAVSKDFNLGTYDEFNEKIKNPEKRRLLYDKVGAKYNLGSFDEFNSKLDEQEPNAPKKKLVQSILRTVRYLLAKIYPIHNRDQEKTSKK